MFGYAFPPISLISRVLRKIEAELCKIILIAPFWPCQPWFQRIVNLLIHPPILLPLRVVVSTSLQDPPADPRDTSPDVLAVVERSLRTAGLSANAASMAARGRRVSTLKAYNSRLRHFYRWCRQKTISPSTASIGEISDFLMELFSHHLSFATIKGYRSAIAAIHTGFPDGSTVSNSTLLKQLYCGMYISRPPPTTDSLLGSWHSPLIRTSH